MDEKNILKELLLYKNVSQTELAKISGLKSQGNISRYFFNKNAMRCDTFQNLVSNLNATIKVIDNDTGREWILDYKK